MSGQLRHTTLVRHDPCAIFLAQLWPGYKRVPKATHIRENPPEKVTPVPKPGTGVLKSLHLQTRQGLRQETGAPSTTKTARRFCAQARSFDPITAGRSSP